MLKQTKITHTLLIPGTHSNVVMISTLQPGTQSTRFHDFMLHFSMWVSAPSTISGLSGQRNQAIWSE